MKRERKHQTLAAPINIGATFHMPLIVSMRWYESSCRYICVLHVLLLLLPLFMSFLDETY